MMCGSGGKVSSHLHVLPADVSVQEVSLGLSCHISIASWHLGTHTRAHAAYCGRGHVEAGLRKLVMDPPAYRRPDRLRSITLVAGELELVTLP